MIKENQAYLQRNLNNRSYGNLSKDYLTSILLAITTCNQNRNGYQVILIGKLAFSIEY